MNIEAIVKAIREYNAAENSYRRAHEELRAVIPDGILVLHKIPGKEDYYWTYERTRDSIGESACQGEPNDGRQAIIIEAPARREEFLPRLEEGRNDKL